MVLLPEPLFEVDDEGPRRTPPSWHQARLRIGVRCTDCHRILTHPLSLQRRKGPRCFKEGHP